MITSAILIAAAFVIGFLLGDRRGVKQCNQMLDENWKDLMQAIREDRHPLDTEEGEEDRPTVH
ncbi:hypothetical protein [Sinorhizobium fredii]|uniref:hypothetical protein n=1 Tax=Rhizobium fredii TaxID=380 RepID=UPI0004BCCF45|nr:hypothetical protein [Sinorhizobium fredii]